MNVNQSNLPQVVGSIFNSSRAKTQSPKDGNDPAGLQHRCCLLVLLLQVFFVLVQAILVQIFSQLRDPVHSSICEGLYNYMNVSELALIGIGGRPVVEDVAQWHPFAPLQVPLLVELLHHQTEPMDVQISRLQGVSVVTKNHRRL